MGYTLKGPFNSGTSEVLESIYRLTFFRQSDFSSHLCLPTYGTSNLSLSSDPPGMYAFKCVKGRQILLGNPARETKAMK